MENKIIPLVDKNYLWKNFETNQSKFNTLSFQRTNKIMWLKSMVEPDIRLILDAGYPVIVGELDSWCASFSL